MKKSMIARLPMTYATRRLKAGDEFVAGRRDADLLARIGRATYASDRSVKAEDELARLRAEYQDVVGKRAYHGWNAGELRDKIAEAKE